MTPEFFRFAIEIPATRAISVTLLRPDAIALATHLEDVARFHEQSGTDRDEALPPLLENVRSALGYEESVVSFELTRKTLKALYSATNDIPGYVKTSAGEFVALEPRVEAGSTTQSHGTRRAGCRCAVCG